jgi:methylated-DNA-[protein]-cysteine S-methyltransferase
MTITRTVPTPVGDLLFVGEDDRRTLRGVYFPGHTPAPRLGECTTDDTAFADAVQQLGEWFAGTRTTFDVDVELDGTDFQRAVWDALRAIPYGETVTYGELATAAGRPGAARAIGHAVARNPVSIIVPCHRVVGSSGTLTGYAGGVERKRTLLDLEARAGTGSVA